MFTDPISDGIRENTDPTKDAHGCHAGSADADLS
jgi:hypothetical protein